MNNKCHINNKCHSILIIEKINPIPDCLSMRPWAFYLGPIDSGKLLLMWMNDASSLAVIARSAHVLIRLPVKEKHVNQETAKILY